jgi:hypothetical protein
MVVGRLKRVSVARMEAMMLEGASAAPSTAPANPSKYQRSTAAPRRSRSAVAAE